MRSRQRFLASVMLGIVMTACAPEPYPEIGIADLKSDRWREQVGQTVTLKGYFVDRPAPMLVTSMALLEANVPIPETQYVRLTGGGLEGRSEETYGAFVQITGVVHMEEDSLTRIMTAKFGDVYAVILDIETRPEVIREVDTSVVVPGLYSICDIYPDICELELRRNDNFAILLSGGANAWSAHSRYWNDLKFMYMTLRSTYGFRDENIVVVYKDGNAEDTDMPVDFAADMPGVDSAFAYVGARISSSDLFFMFATNHGGGFLMEEVNATNRGGRVDTSGDETDLAIFEEHLSSDLNGDGDQVDQVRYDEVIYLYNSATDLWDDALADKLSALSYDRMVIVLEPCFSGGNLADLRGPNRIIISAASEYEYSWGGGPGNHDEFSYHFTAALNGATHDGTAVNADVDGDGVVSIVEAFEYAVANDSQPETPWYEDSGDGRGHPGPLPQDGDGVWGATVTLN